MRKLLLLLLCFAGLIACTSSSSGVDTTPYIQITNNGTDTHTITLVPSSGDTVTITDLANGGTVSSAIAIQNEVTYTVTVVGVESGGTMEITGPSAAFIEITLTATDTSQYITKYEIASDDSIGLDF